MAVAVAMAMGMAMAMAMAMFVFLFDLLEIKMHCGEDKLRRGEGRGS